MADKQMKKSWNKKQSSLAQALEGWTHISQTVKEEKVIPPDQKMLNDITSLLKQLKTKMDELSMGPLMSNNTTKHSNQSLNLSPSSTTTQDSKLVTPDAAATPQECKLEEREHEARSPIPTL